MKIDNPHEFKPEGRLKILVDRCIDKQSSSVNPDVANSYYAYCEFLDAVSKMRFAEHKLLHAARGLEHSDYDSLFEGWSRT